MGRLAVGAYRHRYEERGADLYETPPCAVEALLAVESLPQVIWEPACGRGSIAAVLRQHGRFVYATDLIDYGYADIDASIDFLQASAPSFCCGAIVTNPPYRIADRFVAHALRLGIPTIHMLLRLAFLESQRRSSILDSGLLRSVRVFRRRLPMMHRDGWQGNRASSSIAFAWFTWDLAHRGPATIQRI
jgi:hypothetical protein